MKINSHIFLITSLGQLVVCTLCSCVMQTKRIWLFSAHLLPLVARLCLVPLETIVFINKFSMIFTGLEVIYFLASNLLVPYNLAKTAYRELAQVIKWLCVFELHAGLTAFEHDGPERDFLICRINVLPSLPPVTSCLCVSALPGGGSLRLAGSGDVSVEPAGPASSFHVFLASAVCPADLLVFQHQRSAYLKRKALVSLSYQVKPLQLQLGHQWPWWFLEM